MATVLDIGIFSHKRKFKGIMSGNIGSHRILHNTIFPKNESKGVMSRNQGCDGIGPIVH